MTLILWAQAMRSLAEAARATCAACRVMTGIRSRATLCAAIALLTAVAAHADDRYPARPVRIIVGFLPGSSNDILARMVGAKLTELWGQQVVVDNRSGANGIIGSEITARSTPDGHTLVLMTTSHTMNPALYKLPFDPLRSFTPVAMLGTGPLALVAHPSFGPGNVRELIDAARAKPSTITFATAGVGGINHFAAELFAHSTGIRLVHVPYKGGAPALTDVMAGQVHTMFGTLPLALRQVRAGKVKAFGVTALKRSPLMPEVPTIAEQGVAGYEFNTWWGIAGPAGIPAPIVAKLNAGIGAFVTQPESAQRLENEGAEPRPMTPAAFASLITAEIAKWGRVARDAGIRAQ